MGVGNKKNKCTRYSVISPFGLTPLVFGINNGLVDLSYDAFRSWFDGCSRTYKNKDEAMNDTTGTGGNNDLQNSAKDRIKETIDNILQDMVSYMIENGSTFSNGLHEAHFQDQTGWTSQNETDTNQNGYTIENSKVTPSDGFSQVTINPVQDIPEMSY